MTHRNSLAHFIENEIIYNKYNKNIAPIIPQKIQVNPDDKNVIHIQHARALTNEDVGKNPKLYSKFLRKTVAQETNSKQKSQVHVAVPGNPIPHQLNSALQ